MTVPGSMSLLIALFTAGLVASALLVPAAGRIARRLGWYATPTDDRWHSRPVPNVGGVGMLVALTAVVWLAGLLPSLRIVWLTVGLMFLVGFVDDLRPARPGTKLVFQVAIAALMLYVGPAVRITGAPVADWLLAMTWIVGITNAFNLLDNIDGLAAGVAAIAGACFVMVLRIDGGPSLAPVAEATAVLVGVAVGFLFHNFQPASIFMGDGGSHLLGSFLASATLLAAPDLHSPVVPVAVIPVVLLLIPILDTALVTLTRGLAGRSAFSGGRDHTSHRLVALGIGERHAVLVLYALTIAGGCVALALQTLPAGVAWGLGGAYVATLGFVGLYLGHIETRHERHLPAPALLPSELASRYRIYEVLLDALLVTGAYYLAFIARFREPEFSHFLPYFARSLPLVIGCQMLALWFEGKYRQVWRTLGPTELLGLLRASLLGVGVSVIAVLYLHRFEGFSQSMFAFDAVLAPSLIIGGRVALGALDEYLRQRRSRGRTALIYGAGRCGALAVRELLQNGELGLTPVGFVDDDASKRRMRVDGLRVLGTLDDLARILDTRGGRIAAVVVGIRDLSAGRFAQVCEICEARDVQVRRFRFALEDVDWRDRTPGVVRFPGA